MEAITQLGATSPNNYIFIIDRIYSVFRQDSVLWNYRKYNLVWKSNQFRELLSILLWYFVIIPLPLSYDPRVKGAFIIESQCCLLLKAHQSFSLDLRLSWPDSPHTRTHKAWVCWSNLSLPAEHLWPFVWVSGGRKKGRFPFSSRLMWTQHKRGLRQPYWEIWICILFRSPDTDRGRSHPYAHVVR